MLDIYQRVARAKIRQHNVAFAPIHSTIFTISSTLLIRAALIAGFQIATFQEA
jgi:hypothetical protein